MISAELLDLLRCLDTRGPLQLLTPAELQSLNQLIAEGRIVNRAGKQRQEPLEGGLINEQRSVVYPIDAGIPVMIREEAFDVEGIWR